MKGRIAWAVVLLVVGAAYTREDGSDHFFLHLLTGVDVGLTLLLGAAAAERLRLARRTWLPPALGLFAMTPDSIWMLGPFHRDWMDVFLFHVSLDEIVPVALPVLAVLCVGLLLAYRILVLPEQ